MTSYKEILEVLVLPKITLNLPTNKIKLENPHIPDFVKLSDPSYKEPQKINILFGAELFYDMLRPGGWQVQGL